MVRINPPFQKQQYRGLKSAESDLLRRYIQQSEVDPVGLETHINLGPGETQAEFVRENFRRAWQSASQLKADALLETSGEYQLLELKDHIRTSGLGQLLAYRYWLDVERELDKPVRLVVTADDLNPSVVQPMRFHNVQIVPLTQPGLQRLEAGIQATPPFID